MHAGSAGEKSGQEGKQEKSKRDSKNAENDGNFAEGKASAKENLGIGNFEAAKVTTARAAEEPGSATSVGFVRGDEGQATDLFVETNQNVAESSQQVSKIVESQAMEIEEEATYARMEEDQGEASSGRKHLILDDSTVRAVSMIQGKQGPEVESAEKGGMRGKQVSLDYFTAKDSSGPTRTSESDAGGGSSVRTVQDLLITNQCAQAGEARADEQADMTEPARAVEEEAQVPVRDASAQVFLQLGTTTAESKHTGGS